MRVPLGPLAGPLGRDLRRRVLRDAAISFGATRSPVDDTPITGADLVGLPDAAQRYLGAAGVVGRPRERSFLLQMRGRFRRGGSWMPCDAWQCNSVDPVGRIFWMRIDAAGVVPMIGRDAYVAGRGSMRGKVLDLVTVADGAGPEFDVGELVTWLNDAVVIAPSMLLDPCVEFGEVDDRSFRVTVVDEGNVATAVVLLDRDDRVRDFVTDDRWYDGPDGLVRATWRTPIAGWNDTGDRPWIVSASATWDLPDGPLTYVEATFVRDSFVPNPGL